MSRHTSDPRHPGAETPPVIPQTVTYQQVVDALAILGLRGGRTRLVATPPASRAEAAMTRTGRPPHTPLHKRISNLASDLMPNIGLLTLLVYAALAS